MTFRGWRSLLTAACLVLMGCGGGPGSAPPGADDGPLGPIRDPDIRLNSDPPGAELSLVPQLCCAGERVYVVWYDRRGGALDVHFNRSLDGGRTWLDSDRRLDTPAAGPATSLIPRICCAGDAVYVVWYDDRNGATDIYFNRSLDAGASWLAQDVRLDTDAPGVAGSREPRICCDGPRLCVVWYDDRDGSWDIRANRSLDGGTTWLDDDVRVDRDPGTTARAELPRVCCSGGSVYAAWVDERHDGRDVYVNRSLDGGATWDPADIRLNTDGGARGASGEPEIACAGMRVYVVWPDRRDGLGDIRCNVSVDAGAGWLAADLRLDGGAAGSAQSLAPQLCADAAAVYVVWRDQRNGNDDVYFNRSHDGGASWLAEDLRLGDDLAGVNTAFDPGVACRAGRLGVVWRDDRHGRFDVFLAHSSDHGDTWQVPDLRVETDEPGSAQSLAPVVCCGASDAFVAWYDQRHGPGDIFFNRSAPTRDP